MLVLERIYPRQLRCSVPSRLPFIAVRIIDMDFDVAGVSAAPWYHDTAHIATSLGSGGGEGAVFLEANVKEAAVGEGDRLFLFLVGWRGL